MLNVEEERNHQALANWELIDILILGSDDIGFMASDRLGRAGGYSFVTRR